MARRKTSAWPAPARRRRRRGGSRNTVSSRAARSARSRVEARRSVHSVGVGERGKNHDASGDRRRQASKTSRPSSSRSYRRRARRMKNQAPARLDHAPPPAEAARREARRARGTKKTTPAAARDVSTLRPSGLHAGVAERAARDCAAPRRWGSAPPHEHHRARVVGTTALKRAAASSRTHGPMTAAAGAPCDPTMDDGVFRRNVFLDSYGGSTRPTAERDAADARHRVHRPPTHGETSCCRRRRRDDGGDAQVDVAEFAVFPVKKWVSTRSRSSSTLSCRRSASSATSTRRWRPILCAMAWARLQVLRSARTLRSRASAPASNRKSFRVFSRS